jgi:hypothetical protein
MFVPGHTRTLRGGSASAWPPIAATKLFPHHPFAASIDVAWSVRVLLTQIYGLRDRCAAAADFNTPVGVLRTDDHTGVFAVLGDDECNWVPESAG